jgi:DNA replication protein DnaC
MLNGRYLARKPTILTSNLHPRQLAEHLGGRLASRLQESYSVVEADGPDYRRAGGHG